MVYVSCRTVPSLPPPARQLDDSWWGLAYRSNLIGQQQSCRPFSLLFSGHFSHSPQTTDWLTCPGEWADGSVERLVGGSGRLDIRELLEVGHQTRTHWGLWVSLEGFRRRSRRWGGYTVYFKEIKDWFLGEFGTTFPKSDFNYLKISWIRMLWTHCGLQGAWAHWNPDNDVIEMFSTLWCEDLWNFGDSWDIVDLFWNQETVDFWNSQKQVG